MDWETALQLADSNGLQILFKCGRKLQNLKHSSAIGTFNTNMWEVEKCKKQAQKPKECYQGDYCFCEDRTQPSCEGEPHAGVVFFFSL